jgi:hypothetical protein
MTAEKPSTTLRPPWLGFARAAWLIYAVLVVFILIFTFKSWAGITLHSCAGQATCPGQLSLEDVQIAAQMGIPSSFIIALYVISSMLARWSLAIVGLVIVFKRSNDWMALILSAGFISTLIEGSSIPAVVNNPLDVLIILAYIIGTGLWMPIPFIFPNGQFVPRWTRWVAAVITPLIMISLLPLGIPWLMSGILAIWLILGIVSVIYRYRRQSNPTERQQIKWVGIGFLIAFIAAIYWSIGQALYPIGSPSSERVIFSIINAIIYPLAYGSLAACMGVAILRYRLWDVDLLVRRTLVYSLLTGTLALVFFGAVALLQAVFTSLTGQSSAVSVVVSTLGIAAIANPLRSRIQNFIDRRFYRKRYNAERIVEGFTARLRDEVDLEELEDMLVSVVDQTLKPSSISLWVKPTKNRDG